MSPLRRSSDREVTITPLRRATFTTLFVIACLAAVAFGVTRGLGLSMFVGAVVGIVVVAIMNIRARMRRSP